MNKLPQEIINRIASLIPKRLSDELIRPGLASLSKSWQAAIEAYVFRDLRIKNTELSEFLAVFSDTRRPLSRLLDELATWPAYLNVDFFVNIYSPTDVPYRGPIQFSFEIFMEGSTDILGDRYRYSYIRLTDTDQPQVPCIRSFTDEESCRALDPVSSVSLVARFPALSKLRWYFPDPWPFVPLQKKIRHELAASLEKFKISPDTEELEFITESHNFPHRLLLPDLRDSNQKDHLGIALSDLISRSKLRKFTYRGLIDPSFFWPTASDELPPAWESITEMAVHFDYASPSGQWYFKGSPGDPSVIPETDELLQDDVPKLPPGHGTLTETHTAVDFMQLVGLETENPDVEDMVQPFRKVPDDDVIVPLLEAFARRLAHMPLLRTARLSTRSEQLSNDWFVSYDMPGESQGLEKYTDKPDMDLSRARVFFHFPGWVPDEHLVKLYQNIGEKEYGEKAVVNFLPLLPQ
ncbi:hypothetical protein Daesc_006986 [Daldinia eschscholtzii]|uniref:F-box domain-containing protein n=1 Tax=Daldinia eschscholtzii TaxID=292717 RepID=A0AAX6MIJ9_9PEZI